MDKIQNFESKINEISTQLGFREFSFPTEKYETAQRALSRFVKSMNKKIDRQELDDNSDAKIKLDLISSLIKKVNTVRFAEEIQLDKLEFLNENDVKSLLEYHKNKLCKYMQVRFPKELKYHYTILKNYQAYKAFYEKDLVGKESFDKLVEFNKKIFANIKELEQTTLDNLEESLKIKNILTKDFPELFNTKLIEVADSVCKLNREKIEEINKDLAQSRKETFAKKKSEKGKKPIRKAKPRKSISLNDEVTKSKNNKVAYEDKSGAANNPFADLLGDLKK